MSKRTLVWMFFGLLVSALAPAAHGGPPEADKPKAAKPAPRRIAITVTKKGFEPGGIKVTKGEEVTLVFTRKTEQTCAKTVVIRIEDGKKIEKQLPLDTAVEVTVTFAKSGAFSYACGMGMYESVISVQ